MTSLQKYVVQYIFDSIFTIKPGPHIDLTSLDLGVSQLLNIFASEKDMPLTRTPL